MHYLSVHASVQNLKDASVYLPLLLLLLDTAGIHRKLKLHFPPPEEVTPQQQSTSPLTLPSSVNLTTPPPPYTATCMSN